MRPPLMALKAAYGRQGRSEMLAVEQPQSATGAVR